MINVLLKTTNTFFCGLVWCALLFLPAPLSAQPKESNVNLLGSLYIVTTSSAKSIRQLYYDTGKFVVDDVPEKLIKEVVSACKKYFDPNAEFVGYIRSNADLTLIPICATPAPFHPIVIVQLCQRLNLGDLRKWTFSWHHPKEGEFACESVGPPKTQA